MSDDVNEFIRLLDEISEISSPELADPDTIDKILDELADVEIEEHDSDPITVEVEDGFSRQVESSPMIPAGPRDSDAWTTVPEPRVAAPKAQGMAIFKRERSGKRPKKVISPVLASVGSFSKTSEKVEQFKAFRDSDMSELEAALDAISWGFDDD